MNKKQDVNLDTRKIIYSFILNHPGLHLRELSRKLKIPTSTLEYHLRRLERIGLIETDFEQRRARIYANQNFSKMSKKIINALRENTPRNILIYIAMGGAASQNELSNELELSSTVIGKHLKRLIEQNIIESIESRERMIYTAHEEGVFVGKKPKGREVFYRLTRPGNTNIHTGVLISQYLERYKSGIWDDVVQAAYDYLDVMNPDRKMPKKFRDNRKGKDWDRFEHNMYRIFPNPYHI